MILSYRETAVILRDPLIRESWDQTTGARISRARSADPLMVVDGPTQVTLTFDLLLNQCADEGLLAFLAEVNGQYCSAEIFGDWYTAYVTASMVPYSRRAGFTDVSIHMAVEDVNRILITQGGDYITTESGLALLA